MTTTTPDLPAGVSDTGGGETADRMHIQIAEAADRFGRLAERYAAAGHDRAAGFARRRADAARRVSERTGGRTAG